VSKLLTTGMDPLRPPWSATFYPNYCDSDGHKGAILFRLHHSMGDGFVWLQTFMREVVPTSGDAEVVPVARGPKTARPSLPAVALDAVTSTVRLVGSGDDAPGPLRAVKNFDASSSVAARWCLASTTVAQIKAFAKPLGLTVNDVLLGALGQALQRVVQRRREGRTFANPKTTVWVALRPVPDAYKKEVPLVFSNGNLGACYMDLPVGEANTRDSCVAVQSRVQKLKGTLEPLIGAYLLRVFGLLPPVLSALLLPVCAYNSTVSASSLPGPAFDFTLAGARARAAFFFVPCAGKFGVFVTIATVQGRVCFGVNTNTSVLDAAGAQEVCAEFQAALKECCTV